jgi:murein DD-endopeptidase MepM/ murein hydrolase activator NlpD
VEVGGDAPISVQSMTNTLTTDVNATIKQINELAEAGADIVRVSCPDKDSSLSLKKILKYVGVPIVADIHFHYKRAIEAANSGANCLRINPGNIGSKEKVQEILKAAKDNNCSIRIGVNAGSLEKKLLENELYLENISAIVNGKDPIAIQTENAAANNTLEAELSFKKSKEDSLLRIAVEAEDKISITAKKDKKNLDLENVLFFSPIKGVITNGFDAKKEHFGTDIVAKQDEPIKCVFDGVVVIGHWTSETGYVIGVQHANGVFSLYKHNSILFKSVGEYVKSGEVLAVIGNSGELSSGPHLHFELWHKGIAVNPENYISF